MRQQFVFINNEFTEAEKASVAISDLALLRGYGIFDFLKTIDGKPLFIDDHLQRFFYSASQMHLPVGKTLDELKAIIHALMLKNNLSVSGIRLTLTGGYSADGYTVATPNLIITEQPLQLPTQVIFDKGLKLATYAHQRQLPHVKTTDYLMAIWLQPWVKQKAADDILYHINGVVTECPRANFFIVTKEDVIITPTQNILEGITRKRLLHMQLPFKVVTGTVTVADIATAKEAFIASTTKYVLPVVQVDDVVINKGEAGNLTRYLYEELKKL